MRCGPAAFLLLSALCIVPVAAEAQQFTDRAPALGLPGALGAAWGDYNDDGYADLFLAGNEYLGYGARLFRNNGNLTFTDVSAAMGISTAVGGEIAPAWADYDNDGDLDVFVGSDGLIPKLYRNEGDHFVDVAAEAGIASIVGSLAARSAAWCDYDGDNWLDLFVSGGAPRLLHNNRDGTFTDATSSAGMTGPAEPEGANCCAWGDYDNDGLPDLIVTRTEGRRPLLYHSNGDTFSEEGGFLSVVDGGVGVAWLDYDNDRRRDFYITSGPSQTRDWLFHNDGDGAFTDVAASAGMAGDASSSDSVACADYDNDGYADIYVGNTQTGGESLLYHNNCDGTFANVAPVEGMAGTYHDEAAVWADADLDGKMDLFQAGQLISRFFHNNGPAGNWLRLRALTNATGAATLSEFPARDAIGARVELNLDNDDAFPSGRTLTRTIDGGSGFLGQNEQVAHFGVGGSTLVSVRALFPDGSIVTHRSVPVTQQITIRDVPVGRTEIFPDVPLDFWAYEAIEACVDAGIVAGYGDGLYHPEIAVTRDQMAVYIARALAGGDDNVPEFTDSPTFPDVGSDNWALDYVEYAVDQNVVGGYQDGTYHPEYEVTRDQMAVYVARSICDPTGEDGLAGYVPADPRDFPDVASDFWAYTHVEYCVENAVVAGYLDGLYHPEIVVTRDQMAVYVARAFASL
jgi:hypothetical protein